MSARRKRVISTEEIQFNHKPAKMLLTEKKKGVSQNGQTPSIIGICSYCVLNRPVFERCQTLLHPGLTPWWSFPLADGALHKKPHSPTHPRDNQQDTSIFFLLYSTPLALQNTQHRWNWWFFHYLIWILIYHFVPKGLIIWLYFVISDLYCDILNYCALCILSCWPVLKAEYTVLVENIAWFTSVPKPWLASHHTNGVHQRQLATVYPKKDAHGFCFAVLCCGYTLTDFPISIRLTSLALWQSNDCPSASKATLMNMDKYFMWIHYEGLHNHNKAKHNKTCAYFLDIL